MFGKNCFMKCVKGKPIRKQKMYNNRVTSTFKKIHSTKLGKFIHVT